MNRRIGAAQLAADRFVLYAREGAPEMFDTIVALCKKARFHPRVGASPQLWQSVLKMVEAGEGVALVPACVQELRSEGVLFHPIHDRGSYLDVVLAWRRDEPSAVRDGILELVRKNRPEIERSNAMRLKIAARVMARCLGRGSAG